MLKYESKGICEREAALSMNSYLEKIKRGTPE